jgi:RHS repeat-associated protein
VHVKFETGSTELTNSPATISGCYLYSYDLAGNLTFDGVHAYTYDAENRLVSVDAGTTAKYCYDLQNRRVKKVTAAGTTHYVWEGGKVLSEHDGTTGAVLVDYIYSGSALIARVAAGVTNYSIRDRLSVRMTLDTNGNVVGRQAHLPFGEDFAESGQQEKHHFTSYERDPDAGLDYALNRVYSSQAGRFLSVDPYQGKVQNPEGLNRFSYSQGDPINKTDRLGLSPSPTPHGGAVPLPAGAGKIPSELEPEHRCNVLDTCKEMGEKIADWMVDIAIRFSQLV